jgi:RNA polymerase sigma factor (sigma-70 family)
VSQAFVQLLRFYQGPAEIHQARSYLIACLHDALYKQRRTYARRDAPLVVPRDRDGSAVDAASLGRSAGPDPLEQVIELEEAAVGRSLLRELPSEWRAILVLGAAGYSHAEIADRLGLSARQIRKRVSKANARLAELRGERGA